MSDDELTAALRAALPDLQAVYVFGSTARGDAVEGSDLDVAVLTPRPLDPLLRWELQEASRAWCTATWTSWTRAPPAPCCA